jgi:hypothetical protein
MPHPKFIGAWQLIFAEYRFADGTVNAIYGDHPAGLLIYTDDGHIAIQIMRRDRPPFAKNDRLGGTPAETKAAFDGYLAYFGTYTVDEDKRTVTHHLQGSLLPNWISVDQIRNYDLVDDRLTLKTPPLTIGGQSAVGHLIWQRT